MSRQSNESHITRREFYEALEPLTRGIQELQELKELKPRVERLEVNVEYIASEVRRTGITIEQMNTKIDLALDVTKMVTKHEIMSRDHEYRLKEIESKVRLLRRPSRSKN